MLFGPMPVFFVERLREKLGEHAAEANVYSSSEAAAQLREKNSARPISQYPSFDTQQDLLYIEIPLKHLLMVKAELEKMGVSLLEKDFDPGFQRGEYLCPKCAHLSEAPGICPKHKVPLLEFSKFAEVEAGKRDMAVNKFIFLILAIFVAGALYAWYSA